MRPYSARPDWNNDVTLPVGYSVTRQSEAPLLASRPASSVSTRRGFAVPHPLVEGGMEGRPPSAVAGGELSPRRSQPPQSLVEVKAAPAPPAASRSIMPSPRTTNLAGA